MTGSMLNRDYPIKVLTENSARLQRLAVQVQNLFFKKGTSFSKLLREAILCHGEGDYNRAVKLSSEALEIFFSSRLEAVSHRAGSSLRWPSDGLRLTRTELGSCTERLREHFTPRESKACIDYLLCLIREQPPRSFRESLYVLLRDLSRRCLASPQCLSKKRRSLRAFMALRYRVLRRIPEAWQQRRAQARILGLVFHEPEREMQALLQDHEYYFEYNYARRLVHLNEMPERESYLKAFVWPEAEFYRRYISGNSQSRVLLSIHMGDFVGAFRRIAAEAQDGRGAISLRREAENKKDRGYFAAAHLNHRVIRHGQQNPIEIISALRCGNHTLAALFDLKEDFGQTVEVIFFGEKARFVKGPAELAIMGRAPILPFVNFEEEGASIIEMEAAIDTSLLPGESLACATGRITQQLVCLAEKWVRRSPAQWKYLDGMIHYFNLPQASEAPATENAVEGEG